MRWRRTLSLIGGTVLILLGLLWILQGADVVRIRPLLCVADCQPLTGGSVGWLAVGVVTAMVGLAVVGLAVVGLAVVRPGLMGARTGGSAAAAPQAEADPAPAGSDRAELPPSGDR